MTSARISITSALIGVGVVVGGLYAPRLTAGLAVVALVSALLAKRPSASVIVFFILGAVLLDFSPVAVYRYFLVSDLLLLAAVAVQVWIDRRLVVYVPTLLFVLSLGYIAGLFIAFGVAEDSSGAFTWLHFSFLILVYLPAMTTLFVRRPELKTWLAAAIVVSVFVQSLILIGQIANGLEWRVGTRVSGALGAFGLWNYVAAVIALVGIATMPRWSTRVSSLAILCVIGLAEMFLKSRMLWIASILGTCFMFSLHGGRWVRGLVVGAAIFAVVTVGYLGQWYPAAVQRRISDALRPTESADLVARVQVVHDLIGAVEETDGIGIGVGQSERYLREHHSSALVVNIHNVVLHAAVEGGVLACTSIIMLPLAIGVLWRSAMRNARDAVDHFLVNWEFSALLAMYVGAQLTPSLYEHTFYLLMAALASSAMVEKVGASGRRLVDTVV